jgi:hypothetical protein
MDDKQQSGPWCRSTERPITGRTTTALAQVAKASWRGLAAPGGVRLERQAGITAVHTARAAEAVAVPAHRKPLDRTPAACDTGVIRAHAHGARRSPRLLLRGLWTAPEACRSS